MPRYFMGNTRLDWLERMMMDPSRTAPDTDSRPPRSWKKTPRKQDAFRTSDQTNEEESV